jgi:hypothetical protein
MDLCNLFRPLVDLPMIPIERKAMHGDDIENIEHAVTLHVADEIGIDRRNTAETLKQPRIFGPHRRRGELHHLGVSAPVTIDLEVPVGLVVGFVPEHDRFDHIGSLTELNAARAKFGAAGRARQT